MKLVALSTEQAPHISVPLRFFSAAPFFLLLTALLLAMADGNPFLQQRNPALLAATHTLTLGFISMIMLGALQQMLPVAVGNTLPFPGLVAWLSHVALITGTLLFAAGFLQGSPVLLSAAWPVLGLSFAFFISAALYSQARSAARNASKTAIILAILALFAATGIGMLLLDGYSSGSSLNVKQFASAHIALALGGWVLLLIVGVSWQVVPMFQLTPQYPRWQSRGLAPVIFLLIAVQAALLVFDSPLRWLEAAAYNLFWLLALAFGFTTLLLQQQRKRRIPDATLSFFRIGMVALLYVALLALAMQNSSLADALKIHAGLVFLLGFAMSLILGMLYKIVPFLVWFHLFRGGSFHTIPNMKEIIPERWIWRHLWLHLATLAAALPAPLSDFAAQLLILCLLLQSLLLGYTLFSAIATYRHTLQRLQQA